MSSSVVVGERRTETWPASALMSASRRRSMRWPRRMPERAHAMASPMSTPAGMTMAATETGTWLSSGRITASADPAASTPVSRVMPRGWVRPTQARTTNHAVA